VFAFSDDGTSVVSCTYKVIDFECADTPGKKLTGSNHWFLAHIPEDELYEKKHDLMQVGLLIQDWACASGNQLMGDMLNIREILSTGNKGAGDLLTHKWFDGVTGVLLM